jgi:hypothetical protein
MNIQTELFFMMTVGQRKYIRCSIPLILRRQSWRKTYDCLEKTHFFTLAMYRRLDETGDGIYFFFVFISNFLCDDDAGP